MIAWPWLILTAVLSGSVGALVMALLAGGRRAEIDAEMERTQMVGCVFNHTIYCKRVARAYALGLRRGRRQERARDAAEWREFTRNIDETRQAAGARPLYGLPENGGDTEE